MTDQTFSERVTEFAERIAKNEVLAEIWNEVEFINKMVADGNCDMWDYEETFPYTPDFSEMDEDECLEFLTDEMNFDDDDLGGKELEELQEMVESNYMVREIEQWWKVSDWLARKLQDENEVIISGFNIWGNTHSAYAMKENPVLRKIAERILMETESY